MRKCDRTCACGNLGAKGVRRPPKIVRAKCVRVGYLQGAGAMQWYLKILQNILQKFNERLTKFQKIIEKLKEIQLVNCKNPESPD